MAMLARAPWASVAADLTAWRWLAIKDSGLSRPDR